MGEKIKNRGQKKALTPWGGLSGRDQECCGLRKPTGIACGRRPSTRENCIPLLPLVPQPESAPRDQDLESYGFRDDPCRRICASSAAAFGVFWRRLGGLPQAMNRRAQPVKSSRPPRPTEGMLGAKNGNTMEGEWTSGPRSAARCDPQVFGIGDRAALGRHSPWTRAMAVRYRSGALAGS